ncbi:hypothetical protein PG993_000104 [Apiospora rasikravindrae]|uniref:Uncharacterized protein n=1 Tax=Apiospora rasikravindrae TaxID=990691 RepID=A0ABR1U837_9PEZI
MNPSSPACPEDSNSTDCLLRAVLQVLGETRDNNNKFDWDPVTFAFTVILGVLATGFAGATISQAIISARKGYRKANRRAIGDWSTKTTKEWSWTEMNYQYTTRTPIFLIDSLMSWEESETRALASNPSRCTATWPAFFSETGLITLNPPRGRDGLRSVSAEYLPDDLVAAPAYVQGGVVVAAVAVAGVRSWSFGNDLGSIVIVGRTFQFDFRQHPILGLIGAYSRHSPHSQRCRTILPGELRTAMKYALGKIHIKRTQKSGHAEGASNTFMDRMERLYQNVSKPPAPERLPYDSFKMEFALVQQ